MLKELIDDRTKKLAEEILPKGFLGSDETASLYLIVAGTMKKSY